VTDREHFYVIAYWGKHKDVLWTEGDEPYKEDTLYYAMERYLAHGEVTEILETGYYIPPHGNRTTFPASRSDQWREQLRAQGYEIRRPR